MTSSPPPLLRLRTDVLEWRTLNGRIVAVDIRTRQVMEINRTGTLLWGALVEGASRADLQARLAQAHNVEPRRAAEDVEAFLNALDGAGLLAETPVN